MVVDNGSCASRQRQSSPRLRHLCTRCVSRCFLMVAADTDWAPLSPLLSSARLYFYYSLLGTSLLGVAAATALSCCCSPVASVVPYSMAAVSVVSCCRLGALAWWLL